MTTLSPELQQIVEVHRSGDMDRAEQLCRDVIAQAPEDAAAHHLLGLMLGQRGRTEEEITHLLRASELAPNEAGFHLALSIAYRRANRPEDALGSIDRAIEVQPEAAGLRCERGFILLSMGRTSESMASFREAIRLDPNLLRSYAGMGNVHRVEGRLDQAAASYQAALDRSKTDLDAMCGLALVHRAKGELELAASQMREAVDAHPQSAAALILLGSILLQRQQVDEAMWYAKRAVEVAPQSRDGQLLLGQCLLAAGRLQEAADGFERTLKMDAGATSARTGLATIRRLQHDTEAARAVLQKAVQHDPGSIEAWTQLAELAVEQGRTEDARSGVEHALSINAAHGPALLLRARLDRLAQQFDAALAAIEAQLNSGPAPEWEASLLHEKGLVLDAAGRAADAFDCFRQVNEIRARSVSRPTGQDGGLAARLDEAEHVDAAVVATWGDDDATEDNHGPVFVFGFPKSGLDLLGERIGARKGFAVRRGPSVVSEVASRMRRDAGGGRLLNLLDDLTGKQLDELRRSVVPHDGAVRMVEVVPLGWLDQMIVARLFPGATVISVQRDPRDVCLATFVHDFAINELTAHFTTLAGAAALLERVMGIWRRNAQVFSGGGVTIRYEDLVDRPDAAAQVLDRISGLEAGGQPEQWKLTPSDMTMQVGRWQAYREQLAPEFDRLQSLARILEEK